MFTISREGVQAADRDGLLGANRSNSLAIARICNNADRPIPRLHTRVEIVNTLSRPCQVLFSTLVWVILGIKKGF